jgi:uncharacterized protein (TIGR02118 family)
VRPAALLRRLVAAAEPTMNLDVIYPNHDGARFNTSYYRSCRIPLAMKVMNAASVILIEAVPNGSTAAPFAMIAHFQLASSEALQAALGNPAMADVRADVAKFTNIKLAVMLGKSLQGFSSVARPAPLGSAGRPTALQGRSAWGRDHLAAVSLHPSRASAGD